MLSFYHIKGQFQQCEDSLTSTVFDLLKYLPTEIFLDILKRSLVRQKLPETIGVVKEFTFWPRWNAENTGNTNYVEPDLFIRFKEMDLIIEAKRFNENQQSSEQIKNEIIAYNNEYSKEGKALYFIQVGGLTDLEDDDNYSGAVICKTNWSRILEQTVNERNKLNKTEPRLISPALNVLNDLIIGLEMHGFKKREWLSEIKTVNRIESKSLKMFEYARRH